MKMEHSEQRVRILDRRFLKPESVKEYKHYHANVWPELEELYQKSGVTEVSCFLSGDELCVYVEYDPAIREPLEEELNKNPVEQKWQAIMKDFTDSQRPSTRFEEVYRLPPAE
jgi:L-rhamnose mutarotase